MDQSSYNELELIEDNMPVPNLVSIEEMLENSSVKSLFTPPLTSRYNIVQKKYMALSPLQRYYMKALHYGVGSTFLSTLRNGNNRRILETLASLPDVQVKKSGI